MTPILIAIIVAGAICFCFYARVVIKERTRHLVSERDAEREHATQWKDLAVNLTERGLLFRELPLLHEDLKEITKPAEPEPSPSEMSLSELEDEYEQIENPISSSSQGELGRRRELAKAIAMKRRDSDLRDKSEIATEDFVGNFGAADMSHLSGEN